MQVAGDVQVASFQMCPSGSPSVAPHLVQVFGTVQVASSHMCPIASPSVSPHLEQVLGAVHVASHQLCRQAQAERSSAEVSTDIIISVEISLFIFAS